MIKKLNWDSNFFDLNIGKCVINKSIDFTNLKDELNSFDLVYIFSKVQADINLAPIDIRITYNKETKKKNIDSNIFIFNPKHNSYSELLELGYICGHDSRFLKDTFFGKKAFKKLYKEWINKSINDKKIEVLVYVVQNSIKGFVSYKQIDDSKYKIELIAVNPEEAGRGIGKKLIESIEAKIKLNSILQVSTQKSNKRACNFYSSNGFKKIDETYIYHYVPSAL